MEPNVKQFKKGQVIFQDGVDAVEMYIIKAGRVRIAKKVDQKTIELGTFGKNDFFGEMAILTGTRRSATAVALEDCELLTVRRDDFLNALKDAPSWMSAMIRGMAQRLSSMDGRLGKDLIYAKRKQQPGSNTGD